jgi:hypothetical protein
VILQELLSLGRTRLTTFAFGVEVNHLVFGPSTAIAHRAVNQVVREVP